jgi:hypothetical protein
LLIEVAVGSDPSSENPTICRQEAPKTRYIGGTPFFAMIAVMMEEIGAAPVYAMTRTPAAVGDKP